MQLVRESTLEEFPICFECNRSDCEVYATKGSDLYYCSSCWQDFLEADRDWEACRKTLFVANPSSCSGCHCAGPFYANPIKYATKSDDRMDWLCRTCLGGEVPEACLQYPPPLLPFPPGLAFNCRNLVATDFMFPRKGCGIWPTIERNIAILESEP